MSLPFLRRLAGSTLPLMLAVPAFGVSCKTQGAMTEAERAPIVQSARQIALDVQSGRTADLKTATVPEVAAKFDSIAQATTALTPLISGATITVNAVYRLDASDAKPSDEQEQFFCDAADNSSHATLTIQHLPAGQFAFAIVHATGVAKPQQIALLLQSLQAGGPWQLAGFFPKPLMSAGHDGIWYWEKAREYEKAGQPWNAYFYYQTAIYLLLPADFVDSNNFDKLIQEVRAATPPGLPGAQPMTVSVNGTPVSITNLHTDGALGGFDLVVNYEATDVSDPVASRTRAVALMKELLTLHPEWKQAFHGLWTFAHAPNQQPFSIELAMPAIASQS